MAEVREAGGARTAQPRSCEVLDNARVPITADVGEAVAMAPGLMTYPTLLDVPAPRARAYAVETVLDERLRTVVSFAGTSTRIKDVHDLRRAPRARAVDRNALGRSPVATFARHDAALPER